MKYILSIILMLSVAAEGFSQHVDLCPNRIFLINSSFVVGKDFGLGFEVATFKPAPFLYLSGKLDIIDRDNQIFSFEPGIRLNKAVFQNLKGFRLVLFGGEKWANKRDYIKDGGNWAYKRALQWETGATGYFLLDESYNSASLIDCGLSYSNKTIVGSVGVQIIF